MKTHHWYIVPYPFGSFFLWILVYKRTHSCYHGTATHTCHCSYKGYCYMVTIRQRNKDRDPGETWLNFNPKFSVNRVSNNRAHICSRSWHPPYSHSLETSTLSAMAILSCAQTTPYTIMFLWSIKTFVNRVIPLVPDSTVPCPSILRCF